MIGNLVVLLERKNFYICLGLKDDQTSDVIKNHLTKVIKRTFCAVKLPITFTSGKVLSMSIKDKLSHLIASMYINQFTCSCGATYISRNQSSLSTRIRELHRFNIFIFYESFRHTLKKRIGTPE